MGDAAPSMMDVAARATGAAADAARRAPRAALRSFTAVAVVALLALFVWASWLAPWARSSPPVPVPAAPPPADSLVAPATRADLERAIAPLRSSIDSVGARVDRLYERLPAGR